MKLPFLLLLPITFALNQFSIVSDQYTTWGSRFLTGKNYIFSLSETFPNNCGIGCFPSASTCAIWRIRKGTILNNSNWELVSYLTNGDTPVPFCHDFSLTVETNGVTSALAGYITPKLNLRTKQYSNAYLGLPNASICSGDIFRFDSKNYLRNLWAVYKMLNNLVPIDQQIDDILSFRKLNEQSVWINDLFTWVNIVNKIPPKYSGQTAVNPQQLINSKTGYGTLVNGKRYSIHRVSTKRIKEMLVIFSTDGDKYIWDEDAKFTEVSQVRPNGLKEDGYFETDGEIYTVVYHDQTMCGSKARYSCGGIMHSSNLLEWTNPVKLYGQYVQEGTSVFLRQRPSIFRYGGITYLCTSTAVKNAGFYKGKCNGGSRTTCIEMDNI
jgi:hypothetical protein